MKTRYAFPLVLAGALMMTACSAVLQPPAGMSNEELDRLKAICSWITPIAEIAIFFPSTQIVSQFGLTYCSKLNAGIIPSTTDANTEDWLMDIFETLRSPRMGIQAPE